MPNNVVFFSDAAQLRNWFDEHHSQCDELIVGYWKVGSRKASITWSESVDEALCFGWIDGVRNRIDDTSYKIRFTPRKPNSIWSAVNIAKVQSLIEQGRMHATGIAAFERRLESKSRVYAYEQKDADISLSNNELAILRKQPDAWRFFQSWTENYRRKVVWWIISSKKTETREKRFNQLLVACLEKRKLDR